MRLLPAIALLTALTATAVHSQPMAYRDGVRFTGQCSQWDQQAKAESNGPCAVDMEIHPNQGVRLPINLTVFFNGRARRIAVYGNSLCTIGGMPCRFEDTGGETMRVVVDSGSGLEFPATR